MVHSCHPLRHAIVVGVLRFDRELVELSRGTCREPSPVSSETTIGRDSQKSAIPIGNQSQADVAVRTSRVWGAEDGSDKIVVEVRRPQRELRFFERQQTIMMPRGLPEQSKRKGVPFKQSGVSSLCLVNVREQLRTKQVQQGLHRFERPDSTEYFSTVVAGHPHRSDLAGPLVQVEVNRTID